MSAQDIAFQSVTRQELITVSVRDRSREAPWGAGPNHPVTRKIQISAYCPNCGARRGDRKGHNTYDDGAWYWVETWSCSGGCGHIDRYEHVVLEAARIAAEVSDHGQSARPTQGRLAAHSPSTAQGAQ